MRRTRLFEAVLILVASGVLLLSGGVANAVSLKSGPNSAPKSAPRSAPKSAPQSAPCKKLTVADKNSPYLKPHGKVNKHGAPVGTKSAPKSYSFQLSSVAPNKARAGDQVSVTATFVNKGKPGTYGFATFAEIACGGGGAGDGFSAYVGTGESVSQVFTFDTTYFPAGTIDITQSVYELNGFTKVAECHTNSIKLTADKPKKK